MDFITDVGRSQVGNCEFVYFQRVSEDVCVLSKGGSTVGMEDLLYFSTQHGGLVKFSM